MTLDPGLPPKTPKWASGVCSAPVGLGFRIPPACPTQGGARNQSGLGSWSTRITWIYPARVQEGILWVGVGIVFWGLGDISRNTENIGDSDFQYFQDPRTLEESDFQHFRDYRGSWGLAGLINIYFRTDLSKNVGAI